MVFRISPIVRSVAIEQPIGNEIFTNDILNIGSEAHRFTLLNAV